MGVSRPTSPVSVAALTCTVLFLVNGMGTSPASHHGTPAPSGGIDAGRVVAMATPLPGQPRGSPPLHAPLHRVIEQQFPGTVGVYGVAALGGKVLSDALLPNGSFQLVLSDVRTNSSRLVGAVAGGSPSYPQGIAGAGGGFYVSYWNYSAARTRFDEVSPSGALRTVRLPLDPHRPWDLVGGNATALYAAGNGTFVVVDPRTHGVVANYSARLPPNLWTVTALPFGGAIYLAGYLAGNGSSNAYFGSVDITSGRLRTIDRGPNESSGWFASFNAIAPVGQDLAVGGGVQYENYTSFLFYTAQGWLFRYNPATGAFANRSSLLPSGVEEVWALEPGSRGAYLYADAYFQSFAGVINFGGLYEWGGTAKGLRNDTSLLPPGFYGGNPGVTALSGGHLTLGGFDSFAGCSQIVSVRT